MIEEAGAQAAPLLADRQPEEPFGAQTVVILDRVAGVALMCRRPGGEIGRQLAAFMLQAPLLGGELEIHAFCTSSGDVLLLPGS
jgi:hypothetical protein